MSRRFYRGIRCRDCWQLFLDWADHARHVKRERRKKR